MLEIAENVNFFYILIDGNKVPRLLCPCPTHINTSFITFVQYLFFSFTYTYDAFIIFKNVDNGLFHCYELFTESKKLGFSVRCLISPQFMFEGPESW